MVGDTEVSVAQVVCGFGYLAQRVRSIREIGMDVEDAFQVPAFDKLGQRVCHRDGNLVLALTEFRWDERQSQPFVDGFFRAPNRLMAGLANAIGTENQVPSAREG